MAMVGCPTLNLSVAEDPSVRDGGCESNVVRFLRMPWEYRGI